MTLLRRIFAERRAVMIPLTVFLLGNIGVLIGIVWPLQRAVAGGADERHQAVMSLQEARRHEASVKEQRTSKERADQELKKFYSEILPKDLRGSMNAANFFLTRTAKAANVMFKTGQWEPEADKDSRLTKVVGQVTLVGDYANIRRFLYEVETAQEFVIIESVALSQANTTQQDSLLELALSVTTYYVTPPSSRAVTR